MAKTRRINHIFLLLIIALVEYIVFSAHMSGVMVFFACPVVCSVLYVFKSKKQTTAYIIFALFCSLLSYCYVYDITLADNIISFLFAFLQIHLCALVLSECLKRSKISFKESIAALACTNTLITIANLAVIKYYHNVNIIDTVNSSIMQITQSAIKAAQSSALIKDFTEQQLLQMLDLAREAMVMLIPAALIIINFIISFLTYEITASIFKAYIKNRRNNHKFRYLSIGNSLSLVTMLLLIISLMSGSLYFKSVMFNFVLIASFLYVSVGYSVICFNIYKKIKNELIAAGLSLIVLMLAVVSPALLSSINGLSILFFIGLFDANFDFRKINKKKKLL